METGAGGGDLGLDAWAAVYWTWAEEQVGGPKEHSIKQQPKFITLAYTLAVISNKHFHAIYAK